VLRLGYALVYLGFGYGLFTLWFGVAKLRRESDARTPPLACAVMALGLTVASVSLFLPWIEGTHVVTGDTIVQTGWGGLDPFSTLVIALLSAGAAVYLIRPTAGGDDRWKLIASLTICLLALVAGNAIIQLATQRGTELRFGGWVGVAGASVALLGALGGHPAGAGWQDGHQ
jgi:hypothetical protein